MLRTLKLVIAYDGTNYVGWQRQAEGLSIQGLLEEALAPLNAGRAVNVSGSGRTDAGVHAWAQVASVQIESSLERSSIARAINARLPGDIRVREITDAPDGFHARFWCISKTYAYRVLNAPVDDPHACRFLWHIRPALDVGAMRESVNAIIGTHEFAAFQSTGTRVSSTVRTVTRASLTTAPWRGVFASTGNTAAAGDDPATAERLLTFEFTATGFLRHMVRALVGTIVEVGLGRREPGSIVHALASRDRTAAGPTAPAQGLMLMRVEHRARPAGEENPRREPRTHEPRTPRTASP